jgi:hypothetical protein
MYLLPLLKTNLPSAAPVFIRQFSFLHLINDGHCHVLVVDSPFDCGIYTFSVIYM